MKRIIFIAAVIGVVWYMQPDTPEQRNSEQRDFEAVNQEFEEVSKQVTEFKESMPTDFDDWEPLDQEEFFMLSDRKTELLGKLSEH